MKRPHLNRRLVLESPVRTQDGAGGYSETWAPLGEIWAEVTARGGRKAAREGQPVSQTKCAIILRAAPVGNPARPQPHQRFREATRVFTIETVAEHDLQGRYLICLAHQEVVG